jgi:hypothetical protein
MGKTPITLPQFREGNLKGVTSHRILDRKIGG